MAQEFGINKAVVRSLDEALKIENYFKNILILADTTKQSLAHCFHTTINNLEDLSKIGAYSNIAIKIDTGMHRNGILPNELEACIYGALEHNLNITSIFTHYRSADTLSSEYFWQKHQFKGIKEEVKKICAKLDLPKIAFHTSNSNGLFRDNNFDDDYARIGIAAYGYLQKDIPLNTPNLKPVLSLWAGKISSRILKKNQSIGYGATYTAKKDMMVSTYDIGYADGFLRLDPKVPFFTKDGFELLGRVSMDNISIQSEEDNICIYDDVEKLAALHDTIPYEILTSLSPILRREIV
jgi:alanine racemase